MELLPKDNFSALYEVAQTINSLLEPGELLDKVLDIAMHHLSAERGFIVLSEEADPNGYRVALARNITENHASDALSASSSVLLRVLRTGEPLLTFDASSDDRFDASTSIIKQNILSILCIPLKLRDRVIGAVYLDSAKTRRRFTEDSLKFLEVFGGLAATAIENARQFTALRSENERLRNEADPATLFPGIVGKSKAWTSILSVIQRVRDVDVAVLIVGESGTGKELVARAIHQSGSRSTKPFVAINCSAIPEQLVESELFGHKKGAFTGATSEKKGLFEVADGGTLFLDEIGEIPLALQVKLLRAIEEKQIRPVGDIVNRPTSARLLTATNADLQRAVAEGRFREDLFFRLNVVRIELPPLRERIEDIPLLANHFFERACVAHKRALTGIHPDAMGALLRSHWNGNVRELQNTIERAVVLCAGESITVDDLSVPTVWSHGKRGMTLADYERHIIETTLEEMGGNRTRTAERLGVSLRWLQYRLKEWSHE